MRLTRAEIDLKALRDNYSAIRKHVGTNVKIMGVVKANGYGHGIVEVANALTSFGAEYLGVGFLEEGTELRRHGITTPILVLGGIFGSQIREFLEHDLEITVASWEIAESVDHEVAAYGRKKARVHLKIDTGMGRIGVRAENSPEFVEKVCRLKNLEVVGIYSHFATSDERDKSFAREQLRRFNEVLHKLDEMNIDIPLKHMANSGAVLDLPDSYYAMVRPGIMMYGSYPSQETSESIPLRPVMALRSNVVFIKEAASGTSISYGRKYRTSARTKIATIPIGYGDGYSRRLSGKADVLIRGHRYPVAGTVCMDQIMADVGLDEEIHVGDEVVLMGRVGEEEISSWELSEKIGTIPYELCTGITARVPRVFIS